MSLHTINQPPNTTINTSSATKQTRTEDTIVFTCLLCVSVCARSAPLVLLSTRIVTWCVMATTHHSERKRRRESERVRAAAVSLLSTRCAPMVRKFSLTLPLSLEPCVPQPPALHSLAHQSICRGTAATTIPTCCCLCLSVCRYTGSHSSANVRERSSLALYLSIHLSTHLFLSLDHMLLCRCDISIRCAASAGERCVRVARSPLMAE